jgi:hypothetical protein
LRKACGNDERWDFTEGHNVVARLRVLLHETNSSHSLLGQLDMRNGQFLNTIGPGNTLTLASLYGPWPRFLMPFQPWSSNNCIDFDDWWNNSKVTVSRYSSSRKELVTMLANQEGGAHVDPQMKAGLAELRRHGSGWYLMSDEGNSPMHGFEIAAVRGIGFELLWSLENMHGEYLGSLRKKYRDEVEDFTFSRNAPS